MSISLVILGYFAAALSAAAFSPQVYKTWKTKSASDVSIAMFVIQFIASVSWIIYGLVISNAPVYLTNMIILALATLQIALKIKYDRAARNTIKN